MSTVVNVMWNRQPVGTLRVSDMRVGQYFRGEASGNLLQYLGVDTVSECKGYDHKYRVLTVDTGMEHLWYEDRIARQLVSKVDITAHL